MHNPPHLTTGDEVMVIRILWLDLVSKFAYCVGVKAGELKRKLEGLGCTVEDGTKHWIVYYQGRRTTVPRHPGREIKTRTYYSILKELGIERK